MLQTIAVTIVAGALLAALAWWLTELATPSQGRARHATHPTAQA